MAAKSKPAPTKAAAATTDKRKPSDAQLVKLVTEYRRKHGDATATAAIKALRADGYSFSGRKVRVLFPANGATKKAPATKATAKAKPATKAPTTAKSKKAKPATKAPATKRAKAAAKDAVATARALEIVPRRSPTQISEGPIKPQGRPVPVPTEVPATTEVPAGSDGRVPETVGA